MPAAVTTALKQVECHEVLVPDMEPGYVLVRTQAGLDLR